ncbi:UDP-N-acetylmuramoyl-L-alanine--D-glutamate ligase [Selenomonas sp. TAMA-11512]|uniref:UDP-N-acetylmuramoyl-L-alanine--D-glutamate ligase n=1 Tax=Selenomonas sp. TAMA-11512 TaxID=3095337 RepID=UPI003085A237|nr:UDP-N-acetylmuramoyl-L-alanine--D-glutamate ligase [Selenomonas sp. TAMA-11512]
MDLKDKNVLVIGAGISGFAAAKTAAELGARVTLTDAKDKNAIHAEDTDWQAMEQAGIRLALGGQTVDLLENLDLIIPSPAVPVRIPFLQEAIKRGIPVISEVELAASLAKSPIFAITGTNGKTTTTTLLGLLMKEKYGDSARVGGNIGYPLVYAAQEAGVSGAIIAEISSYQMETTKHFHPHIAAVLNLTPDHIKRHGSMQVYQEMKERIFAEQTAEDFLVLNMDDDAVREMKARAKGRVLYFSRKTELEEGAYLVDGVLTIRWQGVVHPLLRTLEMGIVGGHNVENALAAALMAFLAGVAPEAIARVLRSFRGVAHRIEFVRERGGVRWYNDSKATNTDSAIKALESFDGHIVLIAGGDDKGTDLTEFMKLVREKVDDLILVGDAALRFHTAAADAGFPEEHIFETAYSMKTAVDVAARHAAPPQTVLLSPACASFDMFDGFEERGDVFKRLVTELGDA